MNSKQLHILIVEDDDDDVALIELAIPKDEFSITTSRVRDGVEALDYLRRSNGFEEAKTPHLILLDLNMPRMDGREVLKACYTNLELFVPIVVFTSSDDERDIMQSYRLKACSYVTKPIGIGQFRNVIHQVCSYWFGVVTLPVS